MPSQLGPSSASITITDSTVDSPHSVALSGVGLINTPNATLSATSLNFGNETVGTTSPAQSITLSNYGTSMLSVTSITATTNFGETDDCVPSLVSGASCTISVTFTPSASGSLSGTVSVTDNASDSPQSVTLSGSGVAGSCSRFGQLCYPSSAQKCCQGLTCVFEGGMVLPRHVCE